MAEKAKKLAIPADRKVAKGNQVDAPGVPARLVAVDGPFKGEDRWVRIFETIDNSTLICGDEDGRQFRLEKGEGYFPEHEGALPGGVATAEPTKGAAGEKDADRPADTLHGLGAGQDGGVVAGELGEPGAVAGVLPEVRPDKGE